jgi:uncharacterized protein (TIGR03083 family)
MTATLAGSAPRAAALDRPTARRLAETEFDRYLDVLRGLTPEQWAAPTECPGWDVRAVVGHSLGEAEMSASVRENVRQLKLIKKRGGPFIDAMTSLQVEEHAQLSTSELVARFEKIAPKAVRSRARTPGFVRRLSPRDLSFPLNGRTERWRLGFLIDVIMTRDPWMHRVDICRATGAPLELTADHDGVLVDDVVREWAGRHGQPCRLHLTGPAGNEWAFGSNGPLLELDAVEFCRVVSGRAADKPIDDPSDMLATEVPF